VEIPSKLIEEAVEQLSSLPGVGKKTALRFALHLLKRDQSEVTAFSNAFSRMREHIRFCNTCHNVSDAEYCSICSDSRRNASVVCVVEDIRDVMAIESTQQFKGLYHVLGGIISPMDAVGPNDLSIQQLLDRVEGGTVKEVILALSATMEGDTTNFYIFKKLQQHTVHVSTIARGIGIGDELEYADEVTLGRSIMNRTPYANPAVH